MSSARILLFDTSYLMPVFGVDIGVDSAASIQATLARVSAKGSKICISDLSPFEAFIKSYRISEKLKDERGMEEAKLGMLYVMKGGWAERIDHNDEEIVEEAFKVRLKHADPFDCFIFGTAKAKGIPLVTEDRSAPNFLEEGLVMSWAELKKSVKN